MAIQLKFLWNSPRCGILYQYLQTSCRQP